MSGGLSQGGAESRSLCLDGQLSGGQFPISNTSNNQVLSDNLDDNLVFGVLKLPRQIIPARSLLDPDGISPQDNGSEWDYPLYFVSFFTWILSRRGGSGRGGKKEAHLHLKPFSC